MERVRVIQAWDDGVTSDERLVALLRRYGAKAAFNLNPGLHERQRVRGFEYEGHPVWRLGLQEWAALYAGFEVAAHSLTHPPLTSLDDVALAAEVAGSRQWLEAEFGQPVPGFCYPFNEYDERVVAAVRAAGFAYARGTGPSECAYPPEEPLLFHPSCHFMAPDFDARYAAAQQRGGVFFFWGHSYELVDEAMWAALEARVAAITADTDAEWMFPAELFGYVAADFGWR